MNVYAGENALWDYFNPENAPPTPLVEIRAHPFLPDGVRIFAKLQQFVPMTNVKSLPAFNMLQRAMDSGDVVSRQQLANCHRDTVSTSIGGSNQNTDKKQNNSNNLSTTLLERKIPPVNHITPPPTPHHGSPDASPTGSPAILPTDTIIERSSGNTILSLSIMGRVLGIPQTKAIVAPAIAHCSVKQLQFFGVQCSVHKPAPPPPTTAVETVDNNAGARHSRAVCEEHNRKAYEAWASVEDKSDVPVADLPGLMLNLGQYDNLHNPEAHQRWTAPALAQQLESLGLSLSVFCAGLGTTGTMVGNATYLRDVYPNLCRVGVARAPDALVPGPRTKKALEGLAFPWASTCDAISEVSAFHSYEASLELCRSGILAGPSSGFALRGLLDFLARVKREEGSLQRLRPAEGGDIVCCFICCDMPFLYLDNYFTTLGDDYFPAVENAELLNKVTIP